MINFNHIKVVLSEQSKTGYPACEGIKKMYSY